MSIKLTEMAFNDAINFAIDEADGDGILFLTVWREGDWSVIAEEFPEFNMDSYNDSIAGEE